MSSAMQKQQENLLLTEHFTWPPISLIDDIINMTNEVLYRCTSILDTELSSLDPALLGFADRAAAEKRAPEVDEDGNAVFPEAKLEIEEGVLKLETLVENALDRNFDRLEIWTLRNIFSLERGGKKEGDKGSETEESVGRWMRLAHYENINTPKNPNLTPEALHTLRRKLQETQKLNAALLAEKTRNDALIAKLRSLLQPPTEAQKREPRSSTSPKKGAGKEGGELNAAPFAFLTHSKQAQALGIQALLAINTSTANPTTTTTSATEEEPTTATTSKAPSRTPLITHTQFTVSQLPYLRTLLANLRPHLATTALPTTAATEERNVERKTYIESQSKRILERRGVDTVDGVEGAVEGARGGGAEEVRALERVAKALGDAKGERAVDERGGQEEEDKHEDAMDLS